MLKNDKRIRLSVVPLGTNVFHVSLNYGTVNNPIFAQPFVTGTVHLPRLVGEESIRCTFFRSSSSITRAI